MYDHRWDNLVKRIIGEANFKNGKTTDAAVKVNVSVIVQRNSPVIWEVTNSAKVEPAKDVIESLACITDTLKQLSAKCENPARLNQVLLEAMNRM